MAKEFKDWIDEFVENGANPKNVPHWPEEAGGGSGTKVVTELPQVGEEHIIYELHTTTPSKFNYVSCAYTDLEIRYIFENEEAFRDFVRDFASHYTNHNRFLCYCLAEDELIEVYYSSGSANWTLFNKEEENVFIYDNERLCVCNAEIDENNALLLNGKQVHIGDSDGILYSLCLIHQVKSKVLCDKYKYGTIAPIMNSTLPHCSNGVPSGDINITDWSSGIVQWVTNDGSIKVALPYVDGKYRYDNSAKHYSDINTGNLYNGEFDWVDIDDFNFKDYVDYETYDTIPLSEGAMDKPFIFDPSGKPITSYWIYTNKSWFNADEIREFETQEKTVSPSTETQEVTPDEGYGGLSKVTINALNLQDKTAYVENGTQFITSDDGFDGLGTVVVKPVRLQKKSIRPTIYQQLIRPDTLYTGLSEVAVDNVTYGIDSNIKAENIKKDVSILGVTGTYEGNLDSITYFLWHKSNNASWEERPFDKKLLLAPTNDVDGFGYVAFVYVKGAKDISKIQVGQQVEFYIYGKGTTPSYTAEVKAVNDDYFLVQHGGNNVYLKRATYAAWENYAALLDIPAAEFRTFTENTSGNDYLYDFYGPIRVNVPPQSILPSTVLITEPFTPTVDDNKNVSISAGTDVVVAVMLVNRPGTPNYVNVKDITTGEGTTVTCGYGPNTADYSCDIRLKASGGGRPYTISSTVTRVGATFASSGEKCVIVVMKK